MIGKLRQALKGVFYSFPIQLLLNHFKRNHILLLCWVLLFAIISGNFGNYMGIPYLFLDPVYVNKVNFSSFLIMGIVIAIFSIAFHITTYINDGHRFSFIGMLSKPFTVFSLNNSIIPFSFFISYVVFIIKYQSSNEFVTPEILFKNVGGLVTGYVSMTFLMFVYLWFTNNDIFKYMVCKVDEKLKQKIKVTRASAMKKLNIARKKQIRVDSFLNKRLSFQKVDDDKGFYDRATILQVFDQNHFNLIGIELFIIFLLLLMGVFKDNEIFQLPAASSFTLFFTIFVMIAGAFSYWFGSWSATCGLILLLVVNFFVKEGVFNKTYKAFGLDYSAPIAPYTLDRIEALNSLEYRKDDKAATLVALNNWRNKFPGTQKPKMVFLCVSGGGQRAALWTLNTLQYADSLTDGKLMKNTMLITGASGGLIGAGYYRELYLRKQTDPTINLYSKIYRDHIGSDNLNAIIFSLLMNDTFTGFKNFHYNGLEYDKDRSYAFEQQLNKNTQSLLDKPLVSYKEPEMSSKIPMMIIAPTVINDGRKLYISPQNVSYMMDMADSTYNGEKVSGVEFLRFFEQQGSENLRFLSALRMSATFPYITPNTTLPSQPPIEIMDAGVTDNFGISDAVRFLFAFKEWIAANTSGVVVVSIRDSQKDGPISEETRLSLFDRFSLPISSIYQNFESLQDITNDSKLDYAKVWFKGDIHRIDIEYIPQDYAKENLSTPDSLRMENVQRASLSWRLTSREKRSVIENIHTQRNTAALQYLKTLLNGYHDETQLQVTAARSAN